MADKAGPSRNHRQTIEPRVYGPLVVHQLRVGVVVVQNLPWPQWRDRVIEVVEAAFEDWDAEPLLARLAEVGVPAGKVRSLDEVYEWDQVASQGLLVDVEHPTLGDITLPGPPLRFFDAAGDEVTRKDHTAPPLLDQHADEIRAWVGGGGA